MKTSAQIFLLAALVLSCTVSTYAQEELWKELQSKAGMLYQQGRYSEAAEVAEEAFNVAENAFGPEHPLVATSLNNLAFFYQLQGKYAEAEPLHKRALKIREKAFGPEHPHVATSLNNLAELYRAQGKYFEAEPLCKRALMIREKALGKNHPDVAQSLNNLAGFYQSRGKYFEAEHLFKRSLKIREKALGKNHPDVAISLNGLAVLYYSQGKYAEAEPLFKRSLKIREKALGPEHPNVATVCENMADLYRQIGKEDEAEKLEARARKIRTGKDEMKQTASWSVTTYGFVMYVPGYELLSGLVTASSSFIILVVICCGLFKFFNRTTQDPIGFFIFAIPVIAGLTYSLPLIQIDFALRKPLGKLSYLIPILQVCTLFALSKPLKMIGRSRWAALWLIMPIYNMVVSWKWANEALVFVVFITPRAKEEHIAQTKKDLKMYEMMDVENVVIKSSCERNGEKIPLKDAKNPICDECKEIKPFHCSYAPL